MRKIKLFLSVFIIISLFGQFANAQEPKQISLRDIFEELEAKFKVSFTYMDEAIDSFQVAVPNPKFNLSQTLVYLKENTPFQFVELKDGYIAVRPVKKKKRFCGYLIDSVTEEPISNALVYSNDIQIITDKTGYFDLSDKAIQNVIFARHVNYGVVKINNNSSADSCLTIRLEMNSVKLKEIVVKSYLTKGIDKKQDGSISIDVQETNILPGNIENDVFFSLQALPGIQSSNETVSDINIRGGSNDQNLILWDGVRLYQSSHFFGLISSISPHIIGQVSLIKNGTSASLGEGVSGTIQLHTRSDNLKKLRIEGGSNLLNSDALLQTSIGTNTSLMLASRYSLNRIFTTPTYEQYFDRAFRDTDVIRNAVNQGSINSDESFGFYDITTKIQHNFSSTDKIELSIMNIHNELEYQENFTSDGDLTSRISSLIQNNILGNLKYERIWSDRFKTIINTSATNYKQESINFDVVNDQQQILENEILETAARIEGLYYISDSIDFKAGFEIKETGIRNYREINKPDFIALKKEILTTNSLFLEGNFRPFGGTYLKLGIRANYFAELSRTRIEPRISISQNIFNNLSAEIQGELKSQTSVQVIDFQTDFLGVENRKWELSNDRDIPLLTSQQISFGLNYKREQFLVTLKAFHKDVDGINTSSQGFQNQFQYIRSSGSYSSQGIDFLLNPKFGDLNSWLTYSYLISNYNFKDLIPPSFPNNFAATHSIGTGISYNFRNFEFSSGFNYRSGLPFTGVIDYNEVEQELIYDLPNKELLKPYFRLDLSAKYKFNISDKLTGTTGISLWNLTNRENIISSYFQYSNEEITRINQSALGITPNLSFRVVYKP